MPGPTPKDPSVRARRNRSSTRTVLSTEHNVKAPKLPAGVVWLPQTKQWWADLWSSGMAPEYLEVHRHGLFRVALLFNEFWHPDTELKQKLEIQVRLEKAEADYGCNPMALRRLEWQIVETTDRQKKSRTSVTPAKKAAKVVDPRARRRLQAV